MKLTVMLEAIVITVCERAIAADAAKHCVRFVDVNGCCCSVYLFVRHVFNGFQNHQNIQQTTKTLMQQQYIYN